MFCGLHVDNGRIGGTMKQALRQIIERYNLNVRLTLNQNIILCDIRHSWRRPITMALAQAGLLVKTYLQFNLLCLLSANINWVFQNFGWSFGKQLCIKLFSSSMFGRLTEASPFIE